MLFSLVHLFAVHNFTVNGQEEITVELGQNLLLDFDYEEVGSTASLELLINVNTFDFPVIKPENIQLIDGGTLDETGVDGHFSYHFENFAIFPENVTVDIRLFDNEIFDEVEISFQQIDSDFLISGKILNEGNFIHTPVWGAFVYSFYNVCSDEVQQLIENPTAEEIVSYFEQERYFISVLSDTIGNYLIQIPDDISEVSCVVDVISSVDNNHDKVSPKAQEIIVDGVENGIDFLYKFPDGNFYGHVFNEDEQSISNASLVITNSDSTNFWLTFSDSTGFFQIPLLNENYSFRVNKTDYEQYSGDFSIYDSDADETIILTQRITHLSSPQIENVIVDSIQFFISWLPVLHADYYRIYSLENNEWILEADMIFDNEWTTDISAERKFYHVKAYRE
jgi:hypothetical protein